MPERVRTQIADNLRFGARTQKPKCIDHWALVKDYKDGMNYRELAAKYSISEYAAIRRVRAEGVEPRKSRGQKILERVKRRKFVREQEEIAGFVARHPISGTEHPKYYSKRWK